ncbi:MAG TPA: tetratricopeptide repeat protein [Candidatus Bathyarchaeia archaeon]|nr:tetratricopeptide repeat protein [Candidatus Bathyarchaeia archaeon]
MTIGRLEKWQDTEGTEVDYYKKILRITPTKYSLLNFLADALYKQAEYEEAIHCWKKLLRKLDLKQKYQFFMKIGQAYEALGEIEFAYHYFGEAMKENKNGLEAIGKFGQMAYLLDNYEDALKAFKIIAKFEPENDVAWHNLGLAYYNLGLHDEAIDKLELSLSLNEESADTWYTIATIYAENFLLDDALYTLEKALSIDLSLQENARQEQSFYSLMESNLFKYLIYSK